MKKISVGLVEKIKVMNGSKCQCVLAKFDTGAKKSSIDKRVAEKLGLSYSSRTRIKSTLGKEERGIVDVELEIKGIRFRTKATLSDRRSMAYPVLIGRNVIHGNFIIDTEKSNKSPGERDLKKIS